MDALHPLARAVVDRVRSKHADRFDTFVAFAWIRRLDDLARQMDGPPAADRGELLDAPIVLGNTTFFAPSFAALELIADRFAAYDGTLYEIAVGWALAHARQPAAIRLVYGQSTAAAEGVVLAWARGLSIGHAAMIEACRELMRVNRADEPRDAGESVGFGSVVSLLIERYGKDAEYWAFAPMGEIRQRLADMAVSNDRKRQAIAEATNTASAPDPNSYGSRALIRFNRAAREFEAWAAKQFGGTPS